MPYIPFERRVIMDQPGRVATQPGELNYQLSQYIRSYIAMHGLSYNTLNELIGVLECLKLELYRRIAAPYEQQKLIENGEVF